MSESLNIAGNIVVIPEAKASPKLMDLPRSTWDVIEFFSDQEHDKKNPAYLGYGECVDELFHDLVAVSQLVKDGKAANEVPANGIPLRLKPSTLEEEIILTSITKEEYKARAGFDVYAVNGHIPEPSRAMIELIYILTQAERVEDNLTIDVNNDSKNGDKEQEKEYGRVLYSARYMGAKVFFLETLGHNERGEYINLHLLAEPAPNLVKVVGPLGKIAVSDQAQAAMEADVAGLIEKIGVLPEEKAPASEETPIVGEDLVRYFKEKSEDPAYEGFDECAHGLVNSLNTLKLTPETSSPITIPLLLRPAIQPPSPEEMELMSEEDMLDFEKSNDVTHVYDGTLTQATSELMNQTYKLVGAKPSGYDRDSKTTGTPGRKLMRGMYKKRAVYFIETYDMNSIGNFMKWELSTAAPRDMDDWSQPIVS